jgi:hypothetical protein
LGYGIRHSFSKVVFSVNTSGLLIGGLASLSWLSVSACSRPPEAPVRLQGTVTAIGSGSTVRDAEVIVEWPAGLGGGTTTVRTDAEGHYVHGRSVRAKVLDCKGATITVRASGYASAYNQSDQDCTDGVLTADFKLFPIPR